MSMLPNATEKKRDEDNGKWQQKKKQKNEEMALDGTVFLAIPAAHLVL